MIASPHPEYPPTLGATLLPSGRTRFLIWAPRANHLEIRIVSPEERLVEMQRQERGYFLADIEGLAAGARYFYRIDRQNDFPDPASKFQPEGVHSPSEVVDPAFNWQDSAWFGRPLSEYIVYEFHVGTFSRERTFDGAIAHLDELVDLGITAVEIMPVAQFPGSRNWGYDGAHPFAVQDSYGGPTGMKRFVDACHQRELAVVLDVVYNHLGPEGNYLNNFGHYFNSRYRTPWGDALNFDGKDSDEVRRYFIENALYWIRDFHIDALRLDAVHAIFDFSARPLLRELTRVVHEQGELCNRRAYVIAESNLNDPRMIRPPALGGNGMDAQWVDDLHHALHTVLTGERSGYYADFHGFSDLVRSYRDGFVFTGQYSQYRGRRHGASSRDLPATSFVVCAQNHDQIGNRMLGERLSALVSFEHLKLTAGAVLLSPYIPMLFMGEEYGETAPFQFFISHADPGLVEAVRKGRREEFATFQWKEEPPDPQSEETFNRCRLNRDLKQQRKHGLLWDFHQTLIRLRRTTPCLANLDRECMSVAPLARAEIMVVGRWTSHDEALIAFHFGGNAVTISVPIPAGRWTRALDSADRGWDGPGSQLPETLQSSGEVSLTLGPHSFAVFTRRH
jgi:maltooligosyltrehalose trehalohydrolase